MKIETIGDLESAMNDLQACDAQMNKKSAQLSEDIANLREEMNEELGDTVSKRALLQNAIEQFAWDNKVNPDIFPMGKKSLILNAGTISFKSGPLSIALKKGTKTEQVVETAKALKLKIIRISEELDKDAVKDLIESEKITDEVLKQLGLVANQSENLTIKLNDQ